SGEVGTGGANADPEPGERGGGARQSRARDGDVFEGTVATELRSNCAASLSRFGVERYLTLARGPDRRTLPLNPVKILDHDGVENRHEYQRHEGGYAQAANLCVAQWLPKRTAMDCQGEQAQHRSADGDEHGAQPHDAGVDERLVE